jgi:hypothetical protein
MSLTDQNNSMPLSGMEAPRTQPEYHSITAWSQHAPFAFWLAAALRPRVYVELGTHYGFSYFAFCQKFAELETGTRCYAIDTWMGDEQASHYGEEVYQTVQQHNEHYAAFSTLVRSTFDEALIRLADKSVELRHVDGRHFYDDVKHDFEFWIPKRTDDAIVLFHDTTARERDFGVWKLCHMPRGPRSGLLVPNCSFPMAASSMPALSSVLGEWRAIHYSVQQRKALGISGIHSWPVPCQR